MNSYKYDFSVVMAIYDVEEFLEEAMQSLLKQTIGFRNIQVIMVDDGSTDGSGDICDRYQKKYPDQVFVIHKENGGPASARNAGLEMAEGKYVSFLDPDDMLSHDTMKHVKAFMDGEGQSADMCCIPMFLFGLREMDHPLNVKFEGGTRVVNLLDEANVNMVVLSAPSSFFRLEAAKKMEFDTGLYDAEDAKETMKVLINNPNLGLVAGPKYHYRRHERSILATVGQNGDSYLAHIRNFSRWILKYAEDRYGYVPAFVQYAVMYDLQPKLRKGSIRSEILPEEQFAEYKNELFRTVFMLDDEVIIEQTNIPDETKVFLLGRKYDRLPKLTALRSRKEKFRKAGDGSGRKYEKGDIMMSYNGINVLAMSAMRTVWLFLDIDEKKRECTLEGYHSLCDLGEHDAKAVLIVNGEIYDCDTYVRDEWVSHCMGEDTTYCIGFKGTIPLTGSDRIYAAIMVKDLVIVRTSVTNGRFFPVTRVYKKAFAFRKGYRITAEQENLRIVTKPAPIINFFRELLFMMEVWQRNLLGGRKAVGGRILYHIIRPHLKKKIWIVSDRIEKADDNGEALFCYLQEHTPEGVETYFAVSKNTADFERISKIGKCVDAMSFKHKMLHLLCDVNISSGANPVTMNPFDGYSDALRDILLEKKFIFLQHGLLEKDGSSWLSRYKKDVTGFVTTAGRERDAIVYGKYYYDPSTIWLTGLPRYDRLYHAESKKITIMPTWRRHLVGNYDAKAGGWQPKEGFEESAYFKFYDGLLNSPRLLEALDEYGYTLQFFPHPIIRVYLDKFHHDKRVHFLPTETLYREVYATSELLATDYSSAVFDFSYLRKPIIYCQFDREDFFTGGHTMTKGYFDYEDDGFGEVVFEVEDAVDTIIDYVKNGCTLKDKYRERIEKFYAYHDSNNCQRVVEKILEACGES